MSIQNSLSFRCAGIVRASIKTILEKSGGKMDITPLDSQAPGTNERIIVIQGNIKEVALLEPSRTF